MLKHGVIHDVTHQHTLSFVTVRLAAESFPPQILQRRFGRSKKQLAEMIGDDAVLLLGLAEIPTPAACLDMSERNLQTRSNQRTGKSGIRIAIDNHPIDSLGL